MIEVVPLKPTSAPSKGSATSETQIQITYSALTGTLNGGSAITSYAILWDAGLGGSMFVLKGVSSNNLDLSATFTSGISSGGSYKFAYYGVNAHGDGAISDTVTIVAATNPTQMTPPSVTYSSLAYMVTFSQPTNIGGTGLSITKYEILFKKSDGTYAEIIPECDGTDSQVISGLECEVALTTLTSAPFSLVQGNQVVVKIRALNSENLYSTYSNPSSSLTYIVARPATPT